jgi:hypothetical protein
LICSYVNNQDFMFHGKGASENVVKFMSEQDVWARQQAAANTKDPFWQHVAAVLAQFDGLVQGYARESTRGIVPALTIFAFQLLNGIGDLFQIKPVSLRWARGTNATRQGQFKTTLKHDQHNTHRTHNKRTTST